MPLPVIADTMRVAVRGTAPNGHAWANILHFRKSGAITFTAAIAILDPLLLSHYSTASGAGSPWRNWAHTTSSLTQFEYTPLDGTSATSVITHVVAGLSGGDPLPASVALVATLRTATRGRSYRGRVYNGPLTEDFNLLGKPTAALVAALQVQWDRFVNTALPGTGVSLVVASYLANVATNVVSVSVDGRWDTQRRRLNA
jgi:hypothetical protein